MLLAASVAMGALSAASNYSSQKAAARAAEKYNAQVVESLVQNYHKLADAEVDILDQSYADSLDAQVQYLQAEASVKNQAAATGTAGGSIDMILGDVKQDFEGNMQNIKRNRKYALSEVASQADAMQSQAHASMESVKKPSYGEAIGAGIQTGISTYMLGSSLGSSLAKTVKVGANGIPIDSLGNNLKLGLSRF